MTTNDKMDYLDELQYRINLEEEQLILELLASPHGEVATLRRNELKAIHKRITKVERELKLLESRA